MSDSEETKQRPLQIHGLPGETEDQAIARTMLNPALQSAATIQQYANSPVELDLEALIDCLEKQNDRFQAGSVARLEEMLLAQSYTLDAIANNLFRRAKNQDYMRHFESYMKLGLRAQNQCRTTLEALLRAKNPKSLNQTNIAHNQQINNRLGNEIRPNELLEETDGERLDPGTPAEAVRADSDLATVGE